VFALDAWAGFAKSVRVGMRVSEISRFTISEFPGKIPQGVKHAWGNGFGNFACFVRNLWQRKQAVSGREISNHKGNSQELPS